MKPPGVTRQALAASLVFQMVLLTACDMQSPSPQDALNSCTRGIWSAIDLGRDRPPRSLAAQTSEPSPDEITETTSTTTTADNAPAANEPTEASSHDIAWFVEFLRSSQAITISSYDSPDMSVEVGTSVRERLVEIIKSSLETVPYDEPLGGDAIPYPGYRLLIASPPYQALVEIGTQYVRVIMRASSHEDYAVSAYYRQTSMELRETIAHIAPSPQYEQPDIRYLLNATDLQAVFDSELYIPRDEGPYATTVARCLASGLLIKEQAFLGQSAASMFFTIDGLDYGVELWDNYFRYNASTYRLDGIFQTVVRVLGTP